MHLLKELIIHILRKEKCRVEFNISNEELAKAVESACFIALNQIKEIIRNDNALGDYEIVEKILCLLEEYGIDVGSCHDY